MCAQHALNMLLQGNYFTADNLVAIAHELDARERAVLGDESHFQSQNYDEVCDLLVKQNYCFFKI